LVELFGIGEKLSLFSPDPAPDVLCRPKFCLQKKLFKHTIKTKILPPKMYFPPKPQYLATRLQQLGWKYIQRIPCQVSVLKRIHFPDRDPTGFCNSEPDPTGFWKKYLIRYRYPNCVDHCIQMFDQRIFSDINRIGSNVRTVLPD